MKFFLLVQLPCRSRKLSQTPSVCSGIVSERTEIKCYILPIVAYSMNDMLCWNYALPIYMCRASMFYVAGVNTTAGSLVHSSILTLLSLPHVTPPILAPSDIDHFKCYMLYDSYSFSFRALILNKPM